MNSLQGLDLAEGKHMLYVKDVAEHIAANTSKEYLILTFEENIGDFLYFV